MKTRLSQRAPTPSTKLCTVGNASRVWHELTTPTGQVLIFDDIADARAHARLRFGPTEQQLAKQEKKR